MRDLDKENSLKIVAAIENIKHRSGPYRIPIGRHEPSSEVNSSINTIKLSKYIKTVVRS